MPPPIATLTDLPPELLDHVVHYLPTASAVSSLGRTSKSLKIFVDQNAWQTFNRSRFPSLTPADAPCERDVARTLTSLSRAWDRRALVATYAEPRGGIVTFPGGKKVEKWRRPRGQTIGFTPQLDVYEQTGPTWQDRKEVLAFSAGAQICLRQTRFVNGSTDVGWSTYRPVSAAEGRDDVTTLHLLRPETLSPSSDENHQLLIGTANGDLQLVGLPRSGKESQDVEKAYFTTQGKTVRSSAILQRPGQSPLLAATLGDGQIALYEVSRGQKKMAPSSEVEIKPALRPDGHPSPNHRAWCTSFLSSSQLAVGVGPSEQAIHVYTLNESGISREGLRRFKLLNDPSGGKPSFSSVYAVTPLPPAAGSSGDGQVFLSGAYDGIVRVHDMRTGKDAEQIYVDVLDDGAVYSILPRGREKLLAGTSRHNLLKVFDLRLGAKCYDYMDAAKHVADDGKASNSDGNFNLFLRPNDNSVSNRGNGQNRGRATSSVYSLASSSACSPLIYAGVENAVMSVALTEVLDRHPDPAHFDPWSAQAKGMGRVFQSNEVLGLAMYDQQAYLELDVQRSLWDTWRAGHPRKKDLGARDERWRSAAQLEP